MSTEKSPQRKDRDAEKLKRQNDRWQRLNGTAVRYNADGTVKEEVKTWLPYLLKAKEAASKKSRTRRKKVGLLA